MMAKRMYEDAEGSVPAQSHTVSTLLLTRTLKGRSQNIEKG
jgi:hypothetical protein